MQAWEAIQKTLDYMEEHYEEELTIEQLSTIAHLSRFYYQRLFYRLTGYTVSEYLRSVRLKMAAGLLKADSGKIMDIAMQCGFSSHSTLTRAFRQCYGMSPAEYRIIGYPSGSCDKASRGIEEPWWMKVCPLICDDGFGNSQER